METNENDNTAKFVVCTKSSTKREVYRITGLAQETSQIT